MLSVQDDKRSTPRTASRGSSTARTSMLRRRDISSAKASRCAGVAAILFFSPVAVLIPGPGDDVRFHADSKKSVVRPLHCAPTEIAIRSLGRHIHVDPRPMDCTAGRNLAESLLLHADAVIHRE